MQAIRTRYIGPSNVRGSRISAACEAKTIYVEYDDALDIEENHRAACEKLMRLLKWTPEHGNYKQMTAGVFDYDYYWVSSNGITTNV